jgi:hypothetical protein
VADPANRRLAITLEIRALSSKQTEAARDATLEGWSPETKATYDERADCISSLCTELFNPDSLDMGDSGQPSKPGLLTRVASFTLHWVRQGLPDLDPR